MRLRQGSLVWAALAAITAGMAPAQTPADTAGARDIVPRDYLVLPTGGGRGGRSSLPTDPYLAELARGGGLSPRAGDLVPSISGARRAWSAAQAAADGTLNLRGGYALTEVVLEAAGVYLLEARGHSSALVNGEPHTGDPYGTGYVRLPVALRAGRNTLLLQPAGRGPMSLKLVPAPRPALLHGGDLTLPDLRRGHRGEMWGAVVIANCSSQPLTDTILRSSLDSSSRRTTVPTIPPLACFKAAFRLDGQSPAKGNTSPLRLTLERGGREVDRLDSSLRVRELNQTYKVTFRSDIDGSIQYYAVNPASSPTTGRPPALFLSLHGAGVEAIGQADAYSPKSWGHLVAPTNRRPFGFDWEDWGREDAMEVLEHARATLGTDPARTYLTGHSMGGHGTWHLGVTYPDRFACVAPSAGWVSFASYAGGAPRPPAPSALEELLLRSSHSSDTLGLIRNLSGVGVYVLHGDADDNVPVGQARTMREQLTTFHHDWSYFEQPGAGHWWDASEEPGADCVDWAPMFDLFARRSIPDALSVRQIDFRTASPGISSRRHWAEIVAVEKQGEPAAVSVRFDPGRGLFEGKTENVARLTLGRARFAPRSPLRLVLDGDKLESVPAPATGDLHLERSAGRWSVVVGFPAGDKSPARTGTIKQGFRRRVVLVYGTRGTPEQNAWSLAKARFDAEQFWYRGNGAMQLTADTEFDPARDRDRSVVLYGNAETNAAWGPLLGDSPVQVRRAHVQVGTRRVDGPDLACLVTRPRPGSTVATVTAIGGTGLVGMRLTDRLPYFVSGTGYPDCMVFGADAFERGIAGVRAAGYFGNDWAVPSGEWVWSGQ